MEANIAYLLFETQPITNKRTEKNKDIIPIKNKLYSTSHIIMLGPHTKFIQNKYDMINIKDGIININKRVVLLIIKICLKINLSASAIN